MAFHPQQVAVLTLTQVEHIAQHLFSIGLFVPNILLEHMSTRVQLPQPNGQVNLRKQGRPTVRTIEDLLRRFAAYSRLCPTIFQICELRIREGRYVCNIKQAMVDLFWPYDLAQDSPANDDRFSRDAYKTVLPMIYLLTMGRTGCRYMIGTELQNLTKPMRDLHQYQQCPAVLTGVIDKIEARLIQLSPIVFTAAERASFTIHDFVQDDTQNAKDLMGNLWQLLIDCNLWMIHRRLCGWSRCTR